MIVAILAYCLLSPVSPFLLSLVSFLFFHQDNLFNSSWQYFILSYIIALLGLYYQGSAWIRLRSKSVLLFRSSSTLWNLTAKTYIGSRLGLFLHLYNKQQLIREHYLRTLKFLSHSTIRPSNTETFFLFNTAIESGCLTFRTRSNRGQKQTLATRLGASDTILSTSET